MNKDTARMWKAKLAAWTHDPAEKSLVLLRDPTGHEKGTVAALRNQIFKADALPDDLSEIVKTADWWASAADRPQFPRTSEDGCYAAWTQVRFDKHPVLIHPLSGKPYNLGSLADVEVEHIKSVSFDHFVNLIVKDAEGQIDYRKTFLRFWREGPESPAPRIGQLWRLLPADTRVPDHSIWEHLNLVSAFAGAMAADPKGQVVLLKMTIGPVQPFIAQARSTSDLWSGSHLLSRILWAGLEELCNKVGPDSVIFPDLHGVPLVDVWLESQQIGFEYRHEKATDENPLFFAALPNLFVAIAPESSALQLALELRDAMRHWIRDKAHEAANMLLYEAGQAASIPKCMALQIHDQLSDFPEVYWSVVPWKLAMKDGKLDTSELARVMQHFYPRDAGAPGFLGNPAWATLLGKIKIEGTEFYQPNPGVLYPALYDLLDRSAAAAKSTRNFEQLKQAGYRCSLCGEREWLATDRAQLEKSRGQRKGTVWQTIASRKPSWAKKGEHLCALCSLKRLWPTLFIEEVKSYLEKKDVERFVISTHAMAVSPTLEKIVEALRKSPEESRPAIKQLLSEIEHFGAERAALPTRLFRDLREKEDDHLFKVVTHLPSLLDRAAEVEEDTSIPETLSLRFARVRKTIKDLTGQNPERYYALLLMDGDNMGAWVSGTDPNLLLPYRKLWHPQITNQIQDRLWPTKELKDYLDSLRPASPARHVSISRALNGFALHLAHSVVEETYTGKILYAGGDDLMAMVSVRDLLDVMLALRCAYSGVPFKPGESDIVDLQIGGGHALLHGDGGSKQLLRLMGHTATASIGAVVAHYSAPMGAVMRELRRAERQAKTRGGKDAFTITLMKRAGGLSSFTAKWLLPSDPEKDISESTVHVLRDLRAAFADKLARQAAYQMQEWLGLLSEESTQEQLAAIIKRQLRRHKRKDKEIDADQLANSIVKLAEQAGPTGRVAFLLDAINLTEFLAREGRA